MPAKPRGLGRGLDALLPKGDGPQVRALPIDVIDPSPFQPRARFDEERVAELASSIGRDGVLQPLLVRPSKDRFEVVAGERRLRAARIAGLTRVPALVRELDDRRTLEIAVVENLQREELTPLEEARAYERLLALGSDQAGVAEAVGRSRSAVANTLRLLRLSVVAQEALEDGRISAGHARAILAQPEADREWALQRIVALGLTVRQAEGLRRERSQSKRSPGEERYRALEEDLARHAGTKVRVQGGKRGRIELHFRSQEELERLLELLGYQA